MLRRDAIHVAERVFQWRRPKRNMVPRHDVIFDMARALREEKAKLPPITVFPVGRDYYVTDGHHRLAAYDTAGWTGAIAARVFLGSLREAERAALRSNSRDKIPMDKPDKFEAAWRLVQQEYSKDTAKSIADDANVATRTVENMRTARRKLKHMGVTEDDLQALSWNSARMKAKGREEWQGVDGDWIETEALKLVDALRNAKLSTQLTKRPQVTAMALSMLADGFAEALVAEWTEPGDPEEFDPFDKRGDESF